MLLKHDPRAPHEYPDDEHRTEYGVCKECLCWPCGCPTVGALQNGELFRIHPRKFPGKCPSVTGAAGDTLTVFVALSMPFDAEIRFCEEDKRRGWAADHFAVERLVVRVKR